VSKREESMNDPGGGSGSIDRSVIATDFGGVQGHSHAGLDRRSGRKLKALCDKESRR